MAIATPAETHFHLAREVLLAGKHVYVEKPLTLEEADAEELIRLAEEQNRVLMVGYLLHYHHEIHWENNCPVPTRAEPERVELEKAEPLRSECQEFLSCRANGQRPVTDGQEGLRVLRVLKQAQEALDDGQRAESKKQAAEHNDNLKTKFKGNWPLFFSSLYALCPKLHAIHPP